MVAAASITLWAAAAAAAEGNAPVTGPASEAAPAAPAAPPAPASQPAAPQAAPTAIAPVLPTGTPATVLDTQDYEGVLGKGVRSSTGEDMGRIIDIILDKDGRPRAAIIDFGGFLGVGSRKIAVDWRSMRFSPDGKPSRLVLQLSRNQVRVSPEYKPGDPIVVLGPASPSVPPDGEPAPSTASSQIPAAQAPAAQPAAPVQAPVAPPPSAAPSPAPDKPGEKTPDK
ncbi:PRC-barrel domain-containing protein [Methylobacterium sp. Leaf93]|uniref:PRC-barrel domain-containing protein n=1 Tax=Methylobacterium sp. Leaf93 TaxID=1736249 RepID=UPI0006FCAFDE|nr:PRC-barrel domain-containing protein [Methylobacterium sp. Leaf93]KQP03250.1 photosystem reaction center protein H [Methylobacterium sp. Leaf93]